VAEIPGWLLALAVPISALLGVVITVVVTRRNATEAQRTAEHEERMRSLRWAAELAVSDVEAEARLGVLELERLGANPAIDEHEQELIDAALEAAQYADRLAVANADPDAQVVFVDESETMEAADAKESE
jgi:ribosome assembly protein YihI (activator of Der GTPase)